jgi:glucose/arabinose dehydrogenase
MKVSVYARGIKSARFFAFNENNTMFVGTRDNDSIYVVQDTDNDGTADVVKPVDSKLSSPHSVFYYEKDLYLGEENRVSVYRNITDDGKYDSKEILVDNLPAGNRLSGGGHKTRTVVIGPDKKMYVSIGSSCNVCEEDDDRRATIMRYNLDGSGGEIYASGLRNTVGFDFDVSGQLYGADMGRDQIGDDIPPEEINKIEKGKNYGWPFCYGKKINNPEYIDRIDYCQQKTESPDFEMQAHSAPLGFMFMRNEYSKTWPEKYKEGYFVALHGSWNRTTPTGYKVVWVDTSGEQPVEYNFFSGWLGRDAEASGRPVGLGFDSRGSLFVSDDKQGLIYKITPN